MSPCSRHPREYGLKLLFLKTEVEKSGYSIFNHKIRKKVYKVRFKFEKGILNIHSQTPTLNSNPKLTPSPSSPYRRK